VQSIVLGTTKVGLDGRCYVIAEAGANHNRDWDMARRLVDVAKAAGSDAVKFQTYSADTLYSRKTPGFKYLEGVSDESTYDLLKSIELPRDWQSRLAGYCAEQEIAFMSTPFDRAAVDELDSLEVPAIKIASFELVDLGLIRYAASKGRPLILSTGMATLGEIEEAMAACQQEGNDAIALLHCVSLYPTPPRLLNLRAIETLRRTFQRPVGLSDHTTGIAIPPAAVSVGAVIIEKHFTLDRSLPGPDHPFAVEPNELKEMIRGIRDVEAAMGSGLKQGPAAEEAEMFRLGRRSIVLTRDVPAGHVLKRADLTVKRPGFGIKPNQLEAIVGRRVNEALEADDILTWDKLQ
jgi:sialic acid synthase SpsE